MDTRLKNRHRLAVFLMILAVVIPASVITGEYGKFYSEIIKESEATGINYRSSEAFLSHFINSNYVLYNRGNGQDEQALEETFGDVYGSFDSIYPYMDYQMTDENGKVSQKSITGSKEEMSVGEMEDYEIGIVISYDGEGTPEAEVMTEDDNGEQNIVLKRLANNPKIGETHKQDTSSGEEFVLEAPKNRTFMYGITEDNFQKFLEEEAYIYYYDNEADFPLMSAEIMILVLIVAAAAILLPQWKSLNTGREKIFRMTFEIPAVISLFLSIFLSENMYWLITREGGLSTTMDFWIWLMLFASIYWLVGCLRWAGEYGFKKYVRERTWCYKFWQGLKKVFPNMKAWAGRQLNRLYHTLDDINLDDKNNRIIFKIVLINFIILLIFCTLWFFGVLGLIVYSVILFYVLRKYFNDLKDKYRLLLNATNKIAEGNLDVQIEGDLGVFSPFRNEIEKIQSGFKKAVDEEVKSQKMKTELITNVSHDLKTPLTAIITYVNLLKEEKDEEKREDYVDVLERKSLRLKVLIEDLFEISKASSQNVTLDLMKVDIVNLFKQVKLELDDKIKEAGLDFRMNLPEDKIVMMLDSQKTYRIFENLLVNITKYAMPHTRVYIEMLTEGEEVVIRMKNISAAELNFNPEEITERFVRGDVSRNTEGSGLGLAIAKSFVELQNGTLKIETEADLYKVEIRFKK